MNIFAVYLIHGILMAQHWSQQCLLQKQKQRGFFVALEHVENIK